MPVPNFVCVVLSFNHPNITARAIQSILKFLPEKQIALVHNGSEPRWVQKLKDAFPNVTHLVESANQGFTGGANFAFRCLFPKFEWIFFMSNDCELLGELQPPLSPGLFAIQIYRRKNKQIESLGGAFWPELGKLRHLRSAEKFNKILQTNHKISRPLPYVPGAAFWLHRDTYEKVGDLDKSLHTYWEDVDYSQRVLFSGCQLGLHNKSKVMHLGGKTCRKDAFYTNYLFRRNRRYISLKYCFSILRPILRFKFYLTDF